MDLSQPPLSIERINSTIDNFNLKNEELYEIQESESHGRFLIASTNIPARQCILRENPLVFGPADMDRDESSLNLDGEEKCRRNIPVCLGCFSRMSQNPDHRCPQCSWPVCDEECAARLCHAENECKLFSETEVSFPPPSKFEGAINKSILVLRCYLLKKLERKNNLGESYWTELCKFEHHNDRRMKKKDCTLSDERVLGNLKYFLKISPHENSAEIESDVLRISGIVNVNAFTTVKEDEGDNGVVIAQCLFLKSSLFSHSCIPNATWTIGSPPSFTMVIRAAIAIEKGQMITIPYSVRDNLYGTLQRMISTEDVAHFTCACERCRDPSESSTFVSAIKCPNCPTGYVLPVNPTIPNSNWTCRILKEELKDEDADEDEGHEICETILSVNKIVNILHTIENQIENVKRRSRQEFSFDLNCQTFEDLGEKSLKILHKNHYLIQEIRFSIVKKQAGHLRQLTESQRQKFIDHCECLLKISNVLTPGFCAHRAFLQFYMARALHVHVFEMELQLRNLEECGEEESEMMMNMLNIYHRIQSLETEACLYFQTECELDNHSHPPYYLNKLYTRIKVTEDRVKELEYAVNLRSNKN